VYNISVPALMLCQGPSSSGRGDLYEGMGDRGATIGHALCLLVNHLYVPVYSVLSTFKRYSLNGGCVSEGAYVGHAYVVMVSTA
jgi:hypothetical protein